MPDTLSPRRARGRRPGLTIHPLEHGRYRVAAESRAFPGWQAEEIHVALNEPAPSALTSAVVERVGAALGAREGTGPDDDPLFRSQRRQGFERGRAAGHAAGRAEGRAQMVRQILRSRGVEVSARSPPLRKRSPRRPRRRCWRRRLAARMRRVSLPRSGERTTTAGDLPAQPQPPLRRRIRRRSCAGSEMSSITPRTGRHAIRFGPSATHCPRRDRSTASQARCEPPDTPSRSHGVDGRDGERSTAAAGSATTAALEAWSGPDLAWQPASRLA